MNRRRTRRADPWDSAIAGCGPVMPRHCCQPVLRCGMGWLYLTPVLCIVAAVVIDTVWRSLIRFRCDRCGRKLPAAELSEQGGWSDWCEDCARLTDMVYSASSISGVANSRRSRSQSVGQL